MEPPQTVSGIASWHLTTRPAECITHKKVHLVFFLCFKRVSRHSSDDCRTTSTSYPSTLQYCLAHGGILPSHLLHDWTLNWTFNSSYQSFACSKQAKSRYIKLFSFSGERPVYHHRKYCQSCKPILSKNIIEVDLEKLELNLQQYLLQTFTSGSSFTSNDFSLSGAKSKSSSI